MESLLDYRNCVTADVQRFVDELNTLWASRYIDVMFFSPSNLLDCSHYHYPHAERRRSQTVLRGQRRVKAKYFFVISCVADNLVTIPAHLREADSGEQRKETRRCLDSVTLDGLQ